jgi:hypothetical protein
MVTTLRNFDIITAHHPTSVGKVFAFIFVLQQHCFWVYHTGSYANNPTMLRSPKPLIMRDIFLTKCTAPITNPLSTFYVSAPLDMILNCLFAWAAGMVLVPRLGFFHVATAFFLGGFVSGMAYLFQGQLNPRRLRTVYDCNASSNGGWCSVAALGLSLPAEVARRARLPAILRPVPLRVACVGYIVQALAQEYFPPLRDWYPRPMYFQTTQAGRDIEDRVAGTRSEQPRLTNWGGIGGVFTGFAYAAFVLGMRGNMRAVNRVFASVKKANAAGA